MANAPCVNGVCGRPASDESVHYTDAEKRLGAADKHLYIAPCSVCGDEPNVEWHTGYAVLNAAQEGRHMYVAAGGLEEQQQA